MAASCKSQVYFICVSVTTSPINHSQPGIEIMPLVTLQHQQQSWEGCSKTLLSFLVSDFGIGFAKSNLMLFAKGGSFTPFLCTAPLELLAKFIFVMT